MNERLKELAAEAYRKVNPGPDPYGEADATWMGFGELEKVFAELIVRECAMQLCCQQFRESTDENKILIGQTVILNHFGV